MHQSLREYEVLTHRVRTDTLRSKLNQFVKPEMKFKSFVLRQPGPRPGREGYYTFAVRLHHTQKSSSQMSNPRSRGCVTPDKQVSRARQKQVEVGLLHSSPKTPSSVQ